MVSLLISLIFRQNQTTRRIEGKEPGFTLGVKKAPRKARTGDDGKARFPRDGGPVVRTVKAGIGA